MIEDASSQQQGTPSQSNIESTQQHAIEMNEEEERQMVEREIIMEEQILELKRRGEQFYEYSKYNISPGTNLHSAYFPYYSSPYFFHETEEGLENATFHSESEEFNNNPTGSNERAKEDKGKGTWEDRILEKIHNDYDNQSNNNKNPEIKTI